jgi:hypothetical protein
VRKKFSGTKPDFSPARNKILNKRPEKQAF